MRFFLISLSFSFSSALPSALSSFCFILSLLWTLLFSNFLINQNYLIGKLDGWRHDLYLDAHNNHFQFCSLICSIPLNLLAPNFSRESAILSATILASIFGFSTSLISICGFSDLNSFLSILVSSLIFCPLRPTTRPGREA